MSILTIYEKHKLRDEGIIFILNDGIIFKFAIQTGNFDSSHHTLVKTM